MRAVFRGAVNGVSFLLFCLLFCSIKKGKLLPLFFAHGDMFLMARPIADTSEMTDLRWWFICLPSV